MIEKLEASSGLNLGYKISGTIRKEDYAVMIPELESALQEYGSANLLLDLSQFKWEAINAWGSDMKFGREFHKSIEKLAIIGDKQWQKWLAKISNPFFAKEAKFFEISETQSAWSWLAGE